MTHAMFEPASLAGFMLKNRIVRSATHEGMADEKGFPTEKLKKLYIELAKGNVGAIITGFTGIRGDGKSNVHAMRMIDSDCFIPAYREITKAVHEYETPIIMQIVHCGRQTLSRKTGFRTLAPSSIRDAFYNEDMPKELSEDEISGVIDSFVAAITRTKQAGFDGVQLHAAHGYLLSEFLSSHSNRRDDRWGGSTENRYRIIGEIFERARKVVGDFPILVKINAHDGRERGMKVEEAVQIAKMLEKSGCAAIEVSCGIFEDGLYTVRGDRLPADALMKHTFKYKRLPGFVRAIAKPILRTFMKQPKPLLKYNLDAAIRIKSAVNVPVMVVGGVNNLVDIDCIIRESGIDFVSMCRPFIIEPDIVNKFNQGTQHKSKCVMCNYCLIISEEEPLKCHFGKLTA